ncbi:MAG: hypothetical protein HY927_17030 [Elusimicrobia bacterium]|nr:hypothetical protein [Elusimicrobiota bacterium]
MGGLAVAVFVHCLAGPGWSQGVPMFRGSVPRVSFQVPAMLPTPAAPLSASLLTPLPAPNLSSFSTLPLPAAPSPWAPSPAVTAAAPSLAEPSKEAAPILAATPDGLAQPLSDGADKTPEAAKDAADRAFDALPSVKPLEPPSPAVGVPAGHLVEVRGLPPFLAVADDADRAWVARTLAEAMLTRTGRQVLRRASAVASRRGRPILVQLEELRSENGSFVYDWDMLQLARSLMRDDTGEAAPVLVHELLHVVQRDIGLPSDSLEMELEAHVATLQVFRELGRRPSRRTFSYQFERALLRGGVPGAVRWLGSQYGGNIGILDGGTVAGYIEELEKRRKSAVASIAKDERLLARRTAVLDEMRSAGHPPEALASYEADQLASLRERLRGKRATLGWAERDLAILRSPEGVRHYRGFAQRVQKRVERFHRLLTE